jgi:hypothetical protein
MRRGNLHMINHQFQLKLKLWSSQEFFFFFLLIVRYKFCENIMHEETN